MGGPNVDGEVQIIDMGYSSHVDVQLVMCVDGSSNDAPFWEHSLS